MAGCAIKAENEILKVYKGSLVVMKGVRVNGLYLLQGISILSTVAVVQNQKTSKSQKWHMRLGHLNEKAYKNLLSKDWWTVIKLNLSSASIAFMGSNIESNFTCQNTNPRELWSIYIQTCEDRA